MVDDSLFYNACNKIAKYVDAENLPKIEYHQRVNLYSEFVKNGESHEVALKIAIGCPGDILPNIVFEWDGKTNIVGKYNG